MAQQQRLPLTRKQEREKWTRFEYLKRFPRLTAHIICFSLGYASPMVAADILRAADHGEPHYCEWIDAIYGNNPLPAVKGAFECRAMHVGYMAEFARAYALVEREIGHPGQQMLASWF